MHVKYNNNPKNAAFLLRNSPNRMADNHAILEHVCCAIQFFHDGLCTPRSSAARPVRLILEQKRLKYWAATQKTLEWGIDISHQASGGLLTNTKVILFHNEIVSEGQQLDFKKRLK